MPIDIFSLPFLSRGFRFSVCAGGGAEGVGGGCCLVCP